MGTHRTIKIDDPPLPFFDFIRFIYTDDVDVTMANVLPLIYLADHYRVAGLTTHCLTFIREEVHPTGVLQVLQIIRMLFLKAMLGSWREMVLKSQQLSKFRSLSLAERRALDDRGSSRGLSKERSSVIGTSSMGSGGGYSNYSGGADSVCSGHSRRSNRSRNSARGSANDAVGSTWGSTRGSNYGGDARRDHADPLGRLADDLTNERIFRGVMAEIKISQFVEDLTHKCWKCIQNNTESVVSSPDFIHQPMRVLLQILRLEECTCQEIALFRAAHMWADQRCREAGREPTAERMREALGDTALLRIRFPTMTIEQFQWEVVPSGILKYTDVQPILQALTAFKSQAGSLNPGRFPSEPRVRLDAYAKDPGAGSQRKRDLLEEEESRNSTLPSQGDVAYVADPSDPLDQMVASHLWRHLSEGLIAEAAQEEARLNAISNADEKAAVSSLQGVAKIRRPEMNLVADVKAEAGKRDATPAVSQDSRAARSTPRELSRAIKRLCPGIYRLREDELVEVWLQHGEAMAFNHGPWAAITDFDDSDARYANDPVVEDVVRKELGMSSARPHRGVPLATFLAKI